MSAEAIVKSHLADGDYFLSAENPTATVDQRDLEDLAMRLFARPDVLAARRRAAATWKLVTEYQMPAEQWAMFEEQMIDYCFRGTLMGTNSDPQYPRVLRVYTPHGHWFGRDVPGSKWGGENPDNAYRVMPIEAGAEYEIHGQRQQCPSGYVTFQVVGNTTTSYTVGSLEQRDMVVDPGGRYLITLSSEASDGRPNHIQIDEDAKYVFVRDSMGDWETQAPDALRIRRITPPTRAPWTEDDLAKRVVHAIVWDVPYAYMASRFFLNKRQAMVQYENTGDTGGLVSQINSPGNFHIDEDEAVIITASNNGADYHSAVLHDLFIRSLEYRNHQSSLNQAQSTVDANGLTTPYVIAHRDPGLANWLDTTGLHDVTILLRWQGLPESGPVGKVTINAKTVKLAQLDSELSPGVAKITPEDRKKQLARRARGYDRRFIDH